MLSNFFNLNPPFDNFDEDKLVSHFRNSRDLRSVLYEPDEWPNQLKKNQGLTFNNVSLSKTNFHKVTFKECKFKDCLFIGSSFEDVEFHRCNFINCNFHKVNFTKCYIDPTTIYLDNKYRKSHSNIGIHIYQQIYEDASKSGQDNFARQADFELQRWKRWQLPYDMKTKKITKLDFWIKRFCSVSYELIAGFGYNTWRFIISTLAFFTIISLINMKALSGYLRHEGQIIGDMNFFDSIFYTYSMMTTLGFSTIVPTVGFAKIVAVSEALIGIGWLGIFTALLVKRFLK